MNVPPGSTILLVYWPLIPVPPAVNIPWKMTGARVLVIELDITTHRSRLALIWSAGLFAELPEAWGWPPDAEEQDASTTAPKRTVVTWAGASREIRISLPHLLARGFPAKLFIPGCPLAVCGAIAMSWRVSGQPIMEPCCQRRGQPARR